MEYGRWDVLDTETSVLVAGSAIRQVDLLARPTENCSRLSKIH
jgi:hypothetical protein